ncbi:MAG: CAP domain-containing protein [Pseudomonadota bacterium]
MSIADELERYMLGLINAERTALGLDELQLELNLNESAEDHSTWMLNANVFSHTGSGGSSATQRMETAGFDFSGSWSSAENIAVQSARGEAGYFDDVEDLHVALMNSAGHRANILNANLDYIGIGIEIGGFTYDNGFSGQSVMVTQNFARTAGSVDLDNGNSSGPSSNDPTPSNGSSNVSITHVDSSVSYSLRDQNQTLETLTLTGQNNISGTGNGLNNRITGNSGNNVLNGAWGNDTLIGGAGNDTFRDDKGADRMVGGAGNDTYFIDNIGDVIVENANQGNDHVTSSIAFALRSFGQHLETLTLTGSTNISGTGNGQDNRITGNSGNNLLNGAWGHDTLIGGAGNDTFLDDYGADRMVGGAGNDTYKVDNTGDVIVENSSQGTDHVNASVSIELRDHSQHLESLTLTGQGNISGAGNSQKNMITGNSGNNTLNGAWGNDTLIGGAGF